MFFYLTGEQEPTKWSSEPCVNSNKDTPSQLDGIIERENSLAEYPQYPNLHETETSVENENEKFDDWAIAVTINDPI